MKKVIRKEYRESAIELLKLARGRIEKGLNSAVCIAIDDAAKQSGFGYEKRRMMMRLADRLTNHIADCLQGSAYVTGWLINKKAIDPVLVYEHKQEYRKMWIDSMIAGLQ